MTRQKKPVITPATNGEVDSLLAQYADTDAKISSMTSEMDAKMTAIREEYSPTLTELTEKRETLFNKIQLWAEAGKEELFPKKRSLDMVHGVVGFRTGTPKLKLRKGFTWAAALELIKSKLPGYVRTVEEVAKDRLLADRDNEQVKANMHGVGVEVAQDETFYIELKKEAAPEKSVA